MGLLSNRLDRGSLKPGDHVYSWRAAYIYAHHGIYVGDNKVVHFTRRGQEVATGTILDVLLVSSDSTRSHVPCPTCTQSADTNNGVMSSCLDCFLAGGALYRFEYSSNPALFLAKARGGTCTLAACDPPGATLHRANYLLTNGFGGYNLFNNNCEDFAIYCKTGLIVSGKKSTGPSGQINSIVSAGRLVVHQMTMGQIGQVVSIIGGDAAAALAALLRLVTTNVYGMAVTAVVVYCASRYQADIGRREDVVKVRVEDLTRRLATGELTVVESGFPALVGNNK